ncbi:MAG: DUF3467 domain-containing protein, partial [Acidobacteriota bacterium]|nr:DUF3467 domain-containing protein [Acidobacteriota bacterium]
TLSNWDMKLVFGRIKGENAVEETVEILLTKEMAKVLNILLSTHFKVYEDKFGVVKIPDLLDIIKQEMPPKTETKEQQVLASAARRKKK